MSEVELSSIIFLESLYPRSNFDNDRVNSYRLNLDDLPPIIVQREKRILVDGYHRLLAHRIEGCKTIKVDFIDISKDLILFEAVKRNAKHGLQLSLSEKKSIARQFYKQDISIKEIAEVLAISKGSLSNWLTDLIQDARDEEKRKILDLHLQCMTQQEIAEEIGVSEGKINKILRKIIIDKNEEINQKPLDSLQFFNVWNFPKLDMRYGLKGATGQIPGQIVENVLYYYSEPFDIVVDPMSGGGTTLDVCKAMFRRWRAYDLNPLRDDIKQHDITLGYPKECKNCDLIFLDPPYYNMVFEDLYNDLPDFYNFIIKLAKDSYKTVKKGGYVIFLMGDLTKGKYECLTNECFLRFRKVGFKCVGRIHAPLTTQCVSASQIEQAKKSKKLLGRDRVVYVFMRS